MGSELNTEQLTKLIPWPNLLRVARPLRIVREGAWYHITARGNERRSIFRDDRDRRHFLELIAEMAPLFRVIIHAYVLMENHYHLLAEFSHGNLSRAIQWLNGSYCIWFNRRHNRCGHLLQGRFKAIIVDPARWALELTRYVHLNPVRVRRLGLGKRERVQTRAGVRGAPEKKLIAERLQCLRAFRWSSYRAYIGLAKPPDWLEREEVLTFGGGKASERARNYRKYVEDALREGLDKSPWESLTEQVVLGSEEFLTSLRKLARRSGSSTPAIKRFARPPLELARIIAAVEQESGGVWKEFKDQYGDRRRDLVLYLARKHGGLTLSKLVRNAE